MLNNFGHNLSVSDAQKIVDAERDHALNEGDRYVMAQYLKMVRALSKNASKGDKGASELLLKYVVNPQRQEIGEKKAQQPSSSPQPLLVRAAFAQIQFNITHDAHSRAKPQLKCTEAEFAVLPEEKRTELRDKMSVEFVAPPLLSDGAFPANGVAPAAPLFASKPPNHGCPCGQTFYSAQPSVKLCPTCRKARDLSKLAAAKAKRGKHLSPALLKNLKPTEPDGKLAQLSNGDNQ